ncbi:MAG: radical SAM protein, partial [Clostridia bacterium]|nr:radical SAM protein [Clostridia bacterium]
MKQTTPLTICMDMFGCPNRCLHCWLGHMPNRQMEAGADEWIVGLFKPYSEEIEFYSWLREPDFCADYRERWKRDKRLSVNCEPERFELARFWRLVRDPEYVRFLKEVGVRCVQLTFFGLEETTDRFIGRKGAFRELMQANELLLENEISPRWQAFIYEENREELVELLRLSEKLGIDRRCAEFGGSFKFFI